MLEGVILRTKGEWLVHHLLSQLEGHDFKSMLVTAIKVISSIVIRVMIIIIINIFI